MPRCAGAKADGTGCERIVGASQTHCFAHDPSKAEARSRAAAKGGKAGGRGRPQVEIADVKKELRAIIGDVLSGSLDRATGATVFMGYNTLLKAHTTELAIRDQLDLIERLEALEQAQDAVREARGYGA